ncbi:MAG TPA: TonB-dependent receptor [Pyrinomonadaceae bacterium]|jgi:hypothetical protein
MKRKFLLPAIIFLAAFFPSAPTIRAQQNISGATLSGTVEDTGGAVVKGAIVTIKSLETNQRRSVVSDENGRFRFSFLPVGNYEVRTEADGFNPAILNLTATVGQALEIKIELKIKGVSAQVDVTSDSPVIETARTQIAGTILPKDIEDFPLNGRNFIDLALLLPGVSRTNTGSVQRFAETSAVPGTGISVAGQRNLANSFIVDGSSANDDSVELAGTFYSQEVIREFQVVTNGAVAEFGRASGGFINIVTQSGTNELRGKIYAFLRNRRFDARNPLAPSKDPLTQAQYGASLGAPIVRNRTFFFGNFEQTRRNDAAVITISPASAAAINNRLTAVGYRGALIETGLVPSGFDTTNFFARLDHRINAGNFFSATYNFYDIDAVNARTVGGLNAVTRGTNLANRDHTVNAQNITTAGTRSLNEFRFQFRRSRLSAPAIDRVGPAVNISGVANFGTATGAPTERAIDLYQFTDGLSTIRGNHSLKGGIEYLFNDLNIVFPGAIPGVYTFSNLTNFLNGNYSQFQQAFGAESQKQKNPNVGVFAQDEWKARADLTFNFGLRYDLQFLPDPIKTDTDNLAPRFGIAFAPVEKTVIRASFGIFYDRIPTRATSNALQRDGSKYTVAVFSRNSPGAPVFPNVLSAPPPVLSIKPGITRIDPEIENNSSYQANLQLERALPFDASVAVGYVYLRGLHIILSRNVNVPRCTAATDANLCRPDSNFGNISRYEGAGDSFYHGMIVSFNKRQGDWASLRLSYTLSKSIDDAGNFFFSTPQDNFNLRGERALSDNDQRHRLTLSGTLSAPKNRKNNLLKSALAGFQLSYIFRYASRLPYNLQAGIDLNGDSNFNDRPAGTGRNTGRGFDFASLDLRLSRKFRIAERFRPELLVEGFNLFNRANFSVPNNTVSAAAFGQPTAALEARQIQFGLKLDF